MATEISTAPEATSEKAQSEPILDSEGNIIPVAPSKFDDLGTSPIPRLAAAASLSKPIPTAGQYGIEKVKIPEEMEIPPECYLYDTPAPFQLGKLNKSALSLPEPAPPVELPKSVLDLLDALERAANKVEKARIAASYQEGDKAHIDTWIMYEKEKAVEIAALSEGKKTPEVIESSTVSSQTQDKSLEPAEKKKSIEARKPLKPKSRTTSTSPVQNKTVLKRSGKAPVVPVASVASSPLHPANHQQLKAKLQSKSPGRGDAVSTSKLAPSPRPAKTVITARKATNSAK